MKTYTNIEQSKKLVEFGIDVNTADMWYPPSLIEYGVVNKWWKNPTIIEDIEHSKLKKEYYVPCWSLAALINLLPSEFTTENKFGTFKYTIRIRKYKLTEDIDVYQIAYGNYKFYDDGSSSWKDMINTGEKEELLDAVFDMICWLKENNIL